MRWTFGTVQATTKHRDMVLRPRYGWLGMLVLPTGVLSLLLPLLVIPFVTVMSVLVFMQQGPVVLGGYYLIDVPDLDAALEWAGRCPAAQWGSVEIRPVVIDRG